MLLARPSLNSAAFGSDPKKYMARIGPENEVSAVSPLFARPIVFPVIDSTNRYLADRARAGDPEGLVAIADLQSHGRGRLGRSWVAAPGSSLLCSMLFRPNLAIADAHVIPTIVGLGAQRAISTLTGVNPELKWPNDLLVNGKKVAGLLGEIVTLDERYALVVGIGVNLIWSEGVPTVEGDPELVDLADRATTLFDVSGRRVERDQLTELMLAEIERDYLRLSDGLKPVDAVISEVMDRYREACSTIGCRVRVETTLETYEAEAINVDDQGRLVVRGEGFLRELDAGDVIHLRTT